MIQRIKLACNPDVIVLPLDKILPTRLIEPALKQGVKYKCIAAAVRELVVHGHLVSVQKDAASAIVGL